MVWARDGRLAHLGAVHGSGAAQARPTLASGTCDALAAGFTVNGEVSPGTEGPRAEGAVPRAFLSYGLSGGAAGASSSSASTTSRR